MTSLTKGERLLVYFQRMGSRECAKNHDEAMALLMTLNEVENDLSGTPYNPAEPGTDGRMYPPNEMFRYIAWERPGIRCYRQVAHATFVAENGAVEIRKRAGSVLGEIIFEKPGANGRKVSEHDSSE